METPSAAFAPARRTDDRASDGGYVPPAYLSSEYPSTRVQHELDADHCEELSTHCRMHGAMHALALAWIVEFVLMAGLLAWLISSA